MHKTIPERLEALGQRGEACIILRAEIALPNGARQVVHTLATGERLRPADESDAFETLDGRRRFRLRSSRGA
ncbi:MAG TPA: hypothetical protein VF457_02570 [Burkholderiaceae bacterium]